MRTRAVRQRPDRIPDVDAVLQVGTGFGAPRWLPLVTHYDMTIVQALEHGFSQWQRLSRRAVDARIELQRATCDQALACCVESRWAARSLEVDYGISTEEIFVVGVGSNRAAPRYREGKEWAPPRFLFVGSDWERKNGEAVLRAFGELHRSVPDARLDVVGPHPPLDHPGVTPHGVLPLSDRAAQNGWIASLAARPAS